MFNTKILINEINQYGIYFNSWEQLKEILTILYNLNIQRNDIIDKNASDDKKISNFNNFNINIDDIHKLFNIINTHIPIVKETIENNITNLSFINETVSVDTNQEIMNGFYNKVLCTNDNKYIIRYPYLNKRQPYKIIPQLTNISLCESIMNIILTIIQKHVLKIKCFPNVQAIGFDNKTNFFDDSSIEFIAQDFELNTYKLNVQKSILNSKYTVELIEKADSNSCEYLLSNLSIKTFIQITKNILNKLLILQNKYEFFHGDLKLDNILYKDNDFILSDFSLTQFKINNFIIKNITSTKYCVNYAAENRIYNREILYYLLTTINVIHKHCCITNNKSGFEVIFYIFNMLKHFDSSYVFFQFIKIDHKLINDYEQFYNFVPLVIDSIIVPYYLISENTTVDIQTITCTSIIDYMDQEYNLFI